MEIPKELELDMARQDIDVTNSKITALNKLVQTEEDAKEVLDYIKKTVYASNFVGYITMSSKRLGDVTVDYIEGIKHRNEVNPDGV